MFCPTNCFVFRNNDIYKYFLELNAYKFPVHKLSIDSPVFRTELERCVLWNCGQLCEYLTRKCRC